MTAGVPPLQGRTALVTGASRGIGRAIAQALAHQGASVAVVARSQQPLEALCAALPPGRVHPIPLDLSGAGAGGRAVELAESALGPVHIVVHAAAAMFPLRRVMQLEDAEIDGALVAAVGALTGICRAAVPSMLAARYGRIVAISSLAASHGAAGSALYCAAKAGLEGLLRGLAVDHGRHGITANALAVSFCDTERFRERTDDVSRERFRKATALGRIPTPEEVAQTACFLCREEAGIITGSVVMATAGAHLNNLW